MAEMRKVLFLCTGNYYRSRFAEILFNHLAQALGLHYTAESRALNLSAGNVGPISPLTLRGLAARNISVPAEIRFPIQASLRDFQESDVIIAVKELEHLPMIAAKFASEAKRVEYWNVHDLDLSHPDEALAEIERNVRGLVHRLQPISD